ncbi:MAG: nickel-dependent hydrogenase large subunit [Candidatus Micrarchaeota archaeon]
MSHTELDITIDGISKIEGHADLEVRVRNGTVEDLKLKISENKRFYTQAVRGKTFKETPQIVSRICGTCSVAHLNCSTMAIEKALGFEVSAQTDALRELTMHALMVRDHAMHLYLFCLPDVLGKDSVLDFDEKQHELVHQAFDVKAAGNALSTLVLGRAVHGVFGQVGGYTKAPSAAECRQVAAQLKSVRPHVMELAQVFFDSHFKFERKTNYVALSGENMNYLHGPVCSSEGHCIPEEHFRNYLERVILPYSQALGYTFRGGDYMVGSLARMNVNRAALHAQTRADCPQFLSRFPSTNIYDNNLAQALEIIHSIDTAVGILEGADFKPEPVPEIQPPKQEAVGVDCLEAPRGTLYYRVAIQPDGKISRADIITPSSQNQVNMAEDLKALIPQHLDRSKEEIAFEMEKLIRAYDPCFSCASHFLKVKWL